MSFIMNINDSDAQDWQVSVTSDSQQLHFLPQMMRNVF